MKNRNVRKFITFFSIILMCLLLGFVSNASAGAYKGFSYTISDGKATITGYSGTDAVISIPEKIETYVVTGIGNAAFKNCSSPTSINIPDSVASIGKEAFSDCYNLASITIPANVTSIGINAFAYCFDLTSINVSSNNTAYSSINGILYNKSKKTLIAYPAGKTANSFVTPSTVTSIADFAFLNSNLVSITIPTSVTSIGAEAFRYCWYLEAITLPNGINSIRDRTFQYCENLASITIPESVTSIGNSAFEYCFNLKNINIPASIRSFGGAAFSFCSNISKMTIPNGVTKISNNLFAECESLADITIPDSVTSIGDSAFFGCNTLTSITLPDGVTSIGDSAFSGCENLANITIPDSVASIGKGAFSRCNKMTSFVIPSQITMINDRLFYDMDGLKSVTIHENVTSIGVSAFEDCDNIETMRVPDSVVNIGSRAFSSCDKLRITVCADSFIRQYCFDWGIPVSIVSYPLKIKSITADPSNVYVGTEISWKTSATCGDGTYQFKFALYKDNLEIETSEYSIPAYHISVYYKYTPTEPGTYKVRAYVKDVVGHIAEMDSADVIVMGPLSITSVKADKTSVNVGSAITWTAAAAGGEGTKAYRFLLYKDGADLTSSKYTTSATYKYTPTAAGTYRVRAYVMDSTGTVSLKSADVIAKVPLSITSVKADTTNTVIGSAITWTASATGGSGAKTYRFKLYKNGAEFIGGTFSSASTYKYSPVDAGTYKVRVYVKDSTGTVTKDSADVTVNKPLSITSVTADKTSANVGTAITWTAAATGGVGTKNYRFLVYKDGTELTSSKYTTSAAYKYTPTEAGTYRVRAYVMDSNGTISMKSADVIIMAPLTITSVNSNVTSIDVGSEITWTATAIGGSGTRTYRFKLYKDEIVLVGGIYGSANTYKYTPTEAGTYKVRVYVKDSAVTVTKDSKNVTVE